MDRIALQQAAQITEDPTSTTTTTSSPATIRVFVVRHAERADECSQSEKLLRQKSAEEKAQHSIHRVDSLLTLRGLQQAELCAQVLRQRCSLPSHHITTVFTSPLLRCAQTAAAIANEFKVPVQPVASLGQCALAISRAGLETAISSIYQQSTALTRVCATCEEEAVFLERVDDVENAFLQGVENLVLQELRKREEEEEEEEEKKEEKEGEEEESRRDIIIVAHREAFYGALFKRTGRKLPYKPPYCCIGEFEVVKREKEREEKEERENEMQGGKGGKGAVDNHSSLLQWRLVEYDVGYEVTKLKPSPKNGSKFPRAERCLNDVGTAAQTKHNENKQTGDKKTTPRVVTTESTSK